MEVTMARLYLVLVLFALGIQAQTGPAIDRPVLVSPEQASAWLPASEPVLVVERAGEARAYPWPILIWHELVNDEIAGVPILVSYYPLGDTARVFDRRTAGRAHSFVVSGLQQQSNLVMRDRQTDTLWQQLTGEAVAGTLAGTRLRRMSSQTVPFEVFRRAFPTGRVLSRDTGYRRDYGQDPYARREPLERLLAVISDGQRKAYPFTWLQRQGVVEGRLEKQRFVIFLGSGTAAAGVFSNELGGQRLSFRRKKNQILDRETGSAWNLLGIATAGPLAGKRLAPLEHDVSFASAWLAVHPETQVVGEISRVGDDRHKLPEGVYGRRDQMALQPWP